MKNRSIVTVFLIMSVMIITGCAYTHARREVPHIVWPPAPDTPRVELVNVYYGSMDVEEEGSRVMRFLGEERGVVFERPHGIVADRDGTIYVSDIGSKSLSIHVLDLKNKQYRSIGQSGSIRVGLPLGMAIDNERKLLFVADGASKRVAVYDKDTGEGAFIIGQETGTFARPAAVALDPGRQRVYVADSKMHLVKVFDYKGNFLFSIGKGKRSSENDGFNGPVALDVDSKGNLYVADMFNRYIKVFNFKGEYLMKIGQGVGMGWGNFSKLIGVAIDSEDHIYGLDIDLCNFQIFDQENRLLLAVSRPGTGYGQLYIPTSIFIDENDRIYVTDTFNNRVQVYQYLGGKK